MNYNEARKIAVKYYHLFEPHCLRVNVAGSILRKKPEVKDIELVVLPKTQVNDRDLFAPVTRCEKFIKFVDSFPRVKGNGAGKYAQLILPEGINLDLFIANEQNYGVIQVIRIGSADFSKWLVNEIKKNGFHCAEGHLYKGDELVPCSDEKQFFEITGVEYVLPTERSW